MRRARAKGIRLASVAGLLAVGWSGGPLLPYEVPHFHAVDEIASAASRFAYIATTCTREVDYYRSRDYQITYRMKGHARFGPATFETAYLMAMSRRSREVAHARSHAAWCHEQRAWLEAIGIDDVFLPSL